MAHGDVREGKWRGNWRMEWVASTLHTTSEHGVSSITTAGAHNSAVNSRLNWRPSRFKFAERRNLVSARVPSHFNWPLSHCVLLKITDVRVLHERGARLCPIGQISLRPDLPKTLLSCGQQLPLSPKGRSVKVKWSLLSRPKETQGTFSLPSN